MPSKNNEQKFRTIVTFGKQRTYKLLTISSKYQIEFYVIIIVIRLSRTMVTAGALGTKWIMIESN